MSAVRARIARRALAPGDRLPSVRRFARTMGVSPSTVVEAYDRLEAEGIIRARRGSGFYVTGAGLPPMALAEMGPPRERDVDPFWVSRQSLDADASVLKPGCGWLPADWMPSAALRRGLRALARADDALLSDYGGTRGSPGLRRLLLARLAEEGIAASADQIMLTSSGTQAIDLLCRFFLRPGDTVLVDDPCYFNFQALLRAHQVRLVGVPFTPAGPDTSAFEQALTHEGPRLYITNAALHNPTGASLSPQTAHRVLSLRHGARPDDRRGRHLRGFRAHGLAAPRRSRRPRSRRQDRQLLEDALRLSALRPYRRPGRLDRGAGRSPGRHELRRAEPGRERADRRHPRRRRLPQAHGRAAPAPDARQEGGRPAAGPPGHRALDHAARRFLSVVPPAGRSGFNGDRAALHGGEGGSCTGQCLQRLPVGRFFSQIQCGADERRAGFCSDQESDGGRGGLSRGAWGRWGPRWRRRAQDCGSLEHDQRYTNANLITCR